MGSTTINPTTSLGELVLENPERARLFEAHRIDYCCGGAASLAEACEEEGVDVEQLLVELAELDERGVPDDTREFDSPAELIDFIVEHHHDYLREELEPLGQLVDKVERVHGDSNPELHEIADAYRALARELLSHIAQEEEWVFPAIRRIHEEGPSDGDAEEVTELLDEIDHEHDHAAGRLRRIRDLSDAYTVPEGACASYRNMFARLERLASDTHMHVHRENNILFPQAREQLA
ncbi:MAG: iron-sulfur cluster repair di-iron protein [Persicimonas sp.]